ncbi:MAG: PqqD family protein [Alistipes sp.]|nr:PqqD family protein [Alistipes sp.]
MKIKEQFKVREMAGEHVVIMQGASFSDLTRIISLNESALYLWRAVEGKNFDVNTVAQLLEEYYGIDDQIAHRDAARWVDKLEECGLIED